MIKVSIIVPVYNVEPYIKRCLDSLVNQTLKDIEIILINDCSTDKSLEIAKRYAQNDNRIILIDLPKNQGAAVARNKGLEAAKGEYLGFVDSDDVIDLNYYEELYKKAVETGADIVKCPIVEYNTDGTSHEGVLNNVIKDNNKFYFTYEWQTAIYKSSLVFDNNIIFPPEIRKAQDIVFLNRVVLKSKSIELIDNVFYHYYRREDSLDTYKISIDKIESSLKACEYVADNLNKSLGIDINSDEYIIQYFNKMRTILDYIINKNDSSEAKKLCIEKAIKFYNNCKIKSELEKNFPPISEDILNYIKAGNVDELVNIFSKHKNMKQYFLFKLKKNIMKDLCKTNQ